MIQQLSSHHVSKYCVTFRHIHSMNPSILHYHPNVCYSNPSLHLSFFLLRRFSYFFLQLQNHHIVRDNLTFWQPMLCGIFVFRFKSISLSSSSLKMHFSASNCCSTAQLCTLTLCSTFVSFEIHYIHDDSCRIIHIFRETCNLSV